ncbi:MAG: hypothetical protein R3300_17485 [Candidatus Promineifilaceae bacterium]|nr:hypothetical protein [Candidatus Promineifilaceae bacterium]
MNKRRIALVVVPLLLLTACLGVWHYRTRSTLKAEEVGRFLDVRDGLCENDSSIYPSTERHPFPVYSPDGKYYVEIQRLWTWERRRRLIEMFEAKSGDQVGRYVSSKKSILVLCWAEDSTGIFVADHSPGSGSILIGLSTAPIFGPVIKLLVPE